MSWVIISCPQIHHIFIKVADGNKDWFPFYLTYFSAMSDTSKMKKERKREKKRNTTTDKRKPKKTTKDSC